MNAPEKMYLAKHDVQGQADERGLAINRVGIRGVRYPLVVESEAGKEVRTTGEWAMDVYLEADKRGTHMSRFVELMEGRQAPLSYAAMREMLHATQQLLESHSARLEVRFPYFVRKAAPVSGVESLMDYEVAMIGEVTGDTARVTMRILVPVTSLCPCSRKISRYGAHNQRSHVTITAEVSTQVWPEDLIAIAEEEASCELWSLLKRADEKFVTEHAYENPKFVEDLVRDVAGRLYKASGVRSFVVEAENFESIHNHSAYAMVASENSPVFS
ncbi:GTP cyclohydrolase FolE2 [Paraburkholderia sp. BR13439]|uniref:GTP cyclohydrolase FolE2 n=1 Tax=unclassified Paraburkholderia TaxID=2615204 RepID=UPI0034CFD156